MGMPSRPRVHFAAIAALLVMLIAAYAHPSSRAVGDSEQNQGVTQGPRRAQRFDPLSIRIALSSDHVASGKTLRSHLIVENRSKRTVGDPGCDIGAGRNALIPVRDPEAELWVQPVVDCSGAQEMRPGYVTESDGPEFLAHTKSGAPLPPGQYMAVLSIKGLSQRLAYPVAVE